MRRVDQCRGWGCGLTPYCEKARFIPEAERDQCYVHGFIPTTPGEHCPQFGAKRKKRWGDGAEISD